MPYFLVEARYTAQSMAAMVQSPPDRPAQIRAVVERLGGKMESFWLAFGDHDVVLVCQMPNAQSAAAFSMAVSAGGGVSAIRTTPLISWEEGVLAMRQALEVGYDPPRGEKK
jgi:uncharacterized protein with GYD domain